MSSWWEEDCPARGGGLTHSHWDQCTREAHPGEPSGHEQWQCCHCRSQSRPLPPPIPRVSRVMPPIDVAARLRALGLVPAEETDMEDIRGAIEPVEPEHDDDTPVEPKMAQGSPVGKPDGKGRGSLTYRQQKRLEAVAGWQDYLDAHRDRP